MTFHTPFLVFPLLSSSVFLPCPSLVRVSYICPSISPSDHRIRLSSSLSLSHPCTMSTVPFCCPGFCSYPRTSACIWGCGARSLRWERTRNICLNSSTWSSVLSSAWDAHDFGFLYSWMVFHHDMHRVFISHSLAEGREGRFHFLVVVNWWACSVSAVE